MNHLMEKFTPQIFKTNKEINQITMFKIILKCNNFLSLAVINLLNQQNRQSSKIMLAIMFKLSTS